MRRTGRAPCATIVCIDFAARRASYGTSPWNSNSWQGAGFASLRAVWTKNLKKVRPGPDLRMALHFIAQPIPNRVLLWFAANRAALAPLTIASLAAVSRPYCTSFASNRAGGRTLLSAIVFCSVSALASGCTAVARVGFDPYKPRIGCASQRRRSLSATARQRVRRGPITHCSTRAARRAYAAAWPSARSASVMR